MIKFNFRRHILSEREGERERPDITRLVSVKLSTTWTILTLGDGNVRRMPDTEKMGMNRDAKWGRQWKKKRDRVASFLLISRNETLRLRREIVCKICVCECGFRSSAAHGCTLYRRSEICFRTLLPSVFSPSSFASKRKKVGSEWKQR